MPDDHKPVHPGEDCAELPIVNPSSPALIRWLGCALGVLVLAIGAYHAVEHDGISTMRLLDTLTVPPQGEVAFRPGALHIMATGLKAPLAEGAIFPIILHFRTLPDLAVAVAVRKGAPQ